MIPFQGLIVNRVINYAVVPFVAQAGRTIESWWTALSPEARRRFYAAGFCVFWPLLSLVDALRFMLVRAYVTDGAAANAVWAHSRALNAIAFNSPVDTKTYHWRGQQNTRSYLFPVVLLLTPLFYAADMSRSVAADKINPERHIQVQQHCGELWQNTFGSTL